LNLDETPDELHFIDSNVFFYSIILDGNYGRSCAEVLRKLQDGTILGATSSLVILEVANALRKFGLAKQVRDVVDSVFSLEIKILDMTSSDVRNATEICQRLNINPYDCIHVAVMQHAGIKRIISADRDFDRISEIKRTDPKSFFTNSN